MTAGSDARLQRRIDRERRARIEAEAIAERATSELYEAVNALRRSGAVLELLAAVSAMANEALTSEAALRASVHLVCEHTNWPFGHALLRARGGGDLVGDAGSWRLPKDMDVDAFAAITNRTRFPMA